MVKQYLLASDFDQTLSFNDSGHVMSDMLGINDFGGRVAGLALLPCCGSPPAQVVTSGSSRTTIR